MADPFKIFGFQEYYATGHIGLNRGMITTKSYNHYKDSLHFNSYIFGSSRSQAFKCKDWKPYLNANAVPFHFDASGENLRGIAQKIAYIDEQKDSLTNVLLVIDRYTLSDTQPKKGHMFIGMPCVTKASETEYYGTFLKAALTPDFLVAYADYSLFGVHRPYMEHLVQAYTYRHTVNHINCDIWYNADKEIAADSLEYYTQKINDGTFYQRTGNPDFECPVTQTEIALLEAIKVTFTKHKTHYKIVISPTYDQIPLEENQVALLHKLFGKENVLNFSGVNYLTKAITNYYESSHYRPTVAKEILDSIY
ncbi:hypothetical protein NBRC110019_20670 [Neptunitalea chrysea]|uniref:Uncharacterized protein n=2 Tax=Neptunitalea chrysea TaxID=1647581 RepID=A0A9W6B740_9FLAO|nr:hypothetical protein NBRC110019_20670 [Neptunitalea chrysea]